MTFEYTRPGGEDVESEEKDMVPMVKFYNVPFEFWNPRGLGKIASKLENPLYSDQITNDYARILVEVDVRHKPIFEYKVKKPNQTKFTQHVSYENFPDYCFHCKEFKHGWDSCNVFKKIDELKERNGKQVEEDEGQVGDGTMTEPIAKAKPQRKKGKMTIVEPPVDVAKGMGASTSAQVPKRVGPLNVAKGGAESMVSLFLPMP
ncbi:hypothetical protein LIER_25462 [Lithospermum erythrorhizon]|uniref:DUF4283 domain-containing protein n=1 Tax=Lithospermum erythrorhizon TaxID=34254 RepID=A0AAV3R4X7_LITER